jgi:hypothetical protein
VGPLPDGIVSVVTNFAQNSGTEGAPLFGVSKAL